MIGLPREDAFAIVDVLQVTHLKFHDKHIRRRESGYVIV